MNDLSERTTMNITIQTPHLVNGRAFVSSRDVAASFAKEHRSVLAGIDNLIKQEPSLRLHHFMQTVVERENPSGGGAIQSRAYDMDRDGFALLCMGFTGKKALAWKLRYIEAFNAMEAKLRQPRALPHVPGDAARLAQALASGAPGLTPAAFATDCANRVLTAATGRPLATNRMSSAATALGWRMNPMSIKWNGAPRRVYLNPAVQWPVDPAQRRAAIRAALDGHSLPATMHLVDQMDPAMDMLLLCETVLLANQPIAPDTATALGSTIEQARKMLAPVREAANH